MDYLAPIAHCFGQIAAFPALMNLHADRDLDMIEAAWSDHERFIHVATGSLTLSCLLEAGRHDELLALLACKKTHLWFDDKFGAEALLRQGREDEALAYAEALLQGDRRPWGYQDIAQFCERILVAQGREEEAYRRFGLPSVSGNTYLAMWRDLVKRYPDLDARRDPRGPDRDATGPKGKWFAAAKTAKYLDIALDCAAQPGRSASNAHSCSAGFRHQGASFCRTGRVACDRSSSGRARLRSKPARYRRSGDACHGSKWRGSGRGERVLHELHRLAGQCGHRRDHVSAAEIPNCRYRKG
ncbi:MAG: hypothetical protein V9G14_08650 [Cypionkella sp.]